MLNIRYKTAMKLPIKIKNSCVIAGLLLIMPPTLMKKELFVQRKWKSTKVDVKAKRTKFEDSFFIMNATLCLQGNINFLSKLKIETLTDSQRDVVAKNLKNQDLKQATIFHAHAQSINNSNVSAADKNRGCRLVDLFAHCSPASVNAQDIDGNTPIHYAITGKFYEKHYALSMMKRLIQNGANLELQNNDGDTILHILARHNCLYLTYLFDDIKQLGVNLNIQNNLGNTPLHDAVSNCASGSDESIRMLINLGADLNIKNTAGETPLACAFQLRFREIKRSRVKTLIGSGAETEDFAIEQLHLISLIIRNKFLSFCSIEKLLTESRRKAFAVFRFSTMPNIYELTDPLVHNLLNRFMPQEIEALKFDMNKLHLLYSSKIMLHDAAELLITDDVKLKSSHDFIQYLARTPAITSNIMDFIQQIAMIRQQNRWNDLLFDICDEAIKFAQKNRTFNINNNFLANLIYKLCIGGNIQFMKFVVERLDIKLSEISLASMRLNSTILHKAVESFSLEIVTFLLQSNVEANSVDLNLNTPLHIAINLGCKAMVSELLRFRGVDINCTDKSSRTPLYIACEHNDFEMVKLLKCWDGVEGRFIEPKITNIRGGTPLHTAVSNSTYEVVQFLLDKFEIDMINAQDTSSTTVLHIVAQTGDLEKFRLLMTYTNLNVNVQDNNKETPLHIALRKENLKIVELLLQHSNILFKCDKDGKTPWYYIIQLHYQACFTTIMNSNYNIDNKDEKGRAALHYCALYGRKYHIKGLLGKSCISANAQDLELKTPLHLLMERTNITSLERHNIMLLLLLNGFSNFNAKDIYCFTIMHRMIACCNIKEFDIFSKYGKDKIDPNIQNGAGHTPLHLACINMKQEIVMWLLNLTNINISIKDNSGFTAEDYFRINHRGNSFEEFKENYNLPAEYSTDTRMI